MGPIQLSICMPTYNFGEFIGETLDSIIKQSTPDIEIVVVDGASTDNTINIVRSFQEHFSRLTYHRLDKKGGIDKDLDKTVELARGDYCWLMSSDDVLKPGAMRRVLDEIKLGCDIYLCNRTECDRKLNPERNRLWLSKGFEDQVFNLSKRSDLENYLNASQSIGALFSYMSSIIFCRKKWNEIEYNNSFSGSHYAHVFRLFSMAINNCSMKYIKDPLILCRGGNDSFLDKGFLNRFLIDIDGYHLLAVKLFPDDAKVQGFFKSVMRHEHIWFMLASLKNKIDRVEIWNELERKLIDYGYSSNQLYFARTVGSSPIIMSVARHIRKIIKKFSIF